MNALTAVELNYLVSRYLHESGFEHSAFAFGFEAAMNKCSIDSGSVPPGSLITIVQKGLQYLEMEANLDNVDSDVDDDFLFLQPLDIITKNVDELRKIIKEKREAACKTKEKEVNNERESREHEAALALKNDDRKIRREKEREREKDLERFEQKAKEKDHDILVDQNMDVDQEEKKGLGSNGNEASGGAEPMEISINSFSETVNFLSSEVTVLEGHTSEVCACAWSPSGSLLASGSGDSTARIWRLNEELHQSDSQNKSANVLVLKHLLTKTDGRNKDVTTLDWNGDGTLLATGSYDGQARIWNTDGELKCTLSKHKGPIFTLKWSKKSDYLLTGSCDKNAFVWDVKTETLKQRFDFHMGPILDIDWRNNVSFATSSTDNMIYVCKIGEAQPIKSFSGHKGEVNCVKWDPTCLLLASCSDDISIKIWSMKQDKFVHDLRGHAKEIYTIRWSPTGPGSNNPTKPLLLASASYDSMVKLWNIEQGKLLCNLNGHRGPVYTVAFSPNGEYLATGSFDKCVHIWSLKEEKIIKTFNGNNGIFEVCWNKEGNKIAASFADGKVCVLNFRR